MPRRLVDHQVAVQGWVMVNNPDITGVTNLTTDQARNLDRRDHELEGRGRARHEDRPDPPPGIVRHARDVQEDRARGRRRGLGQALTEDSNGAVTTAVEGPPAPRA